MIKDTKSRATELDTDLVGQHPRIFDKNDRPRAGLLVAYSVAGITSRDRCLVNHSFTVGRQEDTDFQILDTSVSRYHFRINQEQGGYSLEDLGSSNGTYLNGRQVVKTEPLHSQEASVIRAGQVVFVFHNDVRAMMNPPTRIFNIIGSFHAQKLIEQLEIARLSSRHILLSGQSGTGKELAAHALYEMSQLPGPFVTHNAARFTSEEEATSTLFGVKARVFSHVDARAGLIEKADGGILFIDEVHNLPIRVQRSLLRLIEDGEFSRIGETNTRKVDVRFIFASNEPPPTYSLSPDLLYRLRVLQIPPLSERVADIPIIFQHLLKRTLRQFKIGEDIVDKHLSSEHYEVLCLNRFVNDNVRGVVDIADRIATRIANGAQPDQAIDETFSERFVSNIPSPGKEINEQTGEVGDEDENLIIQGKFTGSRSQYELNREVIQKAYFECRGNISATQRLLEKRGIHANRHWLTVYTERWGLPPKSEFNRK